MNLTEMLASGSVGSTEPVVIEQPAEKKVQLKRGQLLRHRKRGTTVAIVELNIHASAAGLPVHLVVESRTGRQFKAVESNLEAAT